MGYKLSEKAADDFAGIFEYTLVNFGELHAQSHLLDLERIMALLVDSPNIGYECNEITDGIRRFNHKHHAIFYRILVNEMLVVRILHHQMNPYLHFPD